MSIERKFIDWQRPGLAAAADFLLERYSSGSAVDLRNVVVALSGARAGRRLLELLVERTDERSLALIPPRIVTAGRLPEELYEAQKPFADPFTQELAWIEALQATDPERLRRVIPRLPEPDELTAWLALAEMLARLHVELAAEALNFEHVVQRGLKIEGFHETQRWQILAEVQARYLGVLDALQLWDMQTARLYAIEQRECATTAEIILVGLVDINRAQRAMLDQVADRVTALVFAPPQVADRFDDHGCLLNAAWQEAEIPLSAGQVEIVDSPGDQADAVLRAVAAFDGRYAADEIVVGVPDSSLNPYLAQRFEECHLPVRASAGTPPSRSAPYRLLETIAEYLSTQQFAPFAALVRHPAIGRCLASQQIEGDWLTELDEYHGQHLPSRPTGKPPSLGKRYDGLHRVHDAITELLRGLTGRPRPLGEWGAAVRDLLITVFGGSDLDRECEADRSVIAACDSICKVVEEYTRLAPQLAPRVTGAEALGVILRSMAAADAIPPRGERSAIELLGWLDLRLDDAPALIVTGFNEGIVPAAQNGDLFLPNSLRRQLQIEDNDQRYARDAYALSVLIASRQDLKIIAGRRSTRNDPLAPSRLLFACPIEELPERTMKFFPRESAKRRTLLPGSLRPGLAVAAFKTPQPQPLAVPVAAMRVTEFKDYLACPYRYYLRHRLNLKSLDDAAEELDGGMFGSLLHNVLKAFGLDKKVSRSTSPVEIGDALNSILNALSVAEFGEVPLPAVRIQIEQVRMRLHSFAQWQADWSKDGWQIRYVEHVLPEGRVSLPVDGRPMFLKGRIDRVDVHERSGECVLFDYKTGDRVETPDQTHRLKTGEWIDLQLPLYRHAAAALEIAGPIKLGYIVMPRDLNKFGPQLAEWSEDDLAEADRVAADIVRKVREEKFWPRTAPPPAYSEEFAAICQDDRFRAFATDEDDSDAV